MKSDNKIKLPSIYTNCPVDDFLKDFNFDDFLGDDSFKKLQEERSNKIKNILKNNK